MDHELFSAKAQAFMARVQQETRARAPLEMIERVEAVVRAQDAWRGEDCLNMNPAEGLLSMRARRILASDMATRATEGVPGDKTFPHNRQNDFVDELEATAIALLRRQFGARFVEWRHASNSMSNMAVFFGLLAHDEPMLVQDMDAGGNYSYNWCGPAGLRTSRIATLRSASETFEIDLDQTRHLAREVRPRAIVVGGGKVLFPYPLKGLREIADEVGAYLVVDAAHLGLLISAGDFQRPLAEGAHVVTMSTHKIFGGPVGGVVLTNEPEIARKVAEITFPGLMQTRDLNKYAALVVSLAELEAHGRPLAARMVANAQRLAAALASEGFEVLGREGEHTRTHQLFLRLGPEAAAVERRWHEANILIPDCALLGDAALRRRTGARLAVHELSRRGMGDAEMDEVARLVAAAARPHADPGPLAESVRRLLARFPAIPFSFDQGQPLSAFPAVALGGAPAKER